MPGLFGRTKSNQTRAGKASKFDKKVGWLVLERSKQASIKISTSLREIDVAVLTDRWIDCSPETRTDVPCEVEVLKPLVIGSAHRRSLSLVKSKNCLLESASLYFTETFSIHHRIWYFLNLLTGWILGLPKFMGCPLKLRLAVCLVGLAF